jgi:hypothetical protein
MSEDEPMKRARVMLIATRTVGCGPKDGSSSASGDDTGGDVPAACAAAGWDTSLATFQALAEDAGDSYWYSVRSVEYTFEWSCSYRTTVEVVAGTVVRRELELTHYENTTPEECPDMPFVEEGDAIGSMAGGFPAYTMEQVYAGCCDLLAIEPPDMYSVVFEVGTNGIVSECYAIENGCGEGCEASVDGFSGFRLEAFGFGSP